MDVLEISNNEEEAEALLFNEVGEEIDEVAEEGADQVKEVVAVQENDKPNAESEAKDEQMEVEEGDKNGQAGEEDKIKDEHFSNKEEFSSENFKIELGGLPKYYPLGTLKKLLNVTLQLEAHKVKPGGMGRNVAYINFKDENARFKALTILNGYKWQGSALTAENADPAKDPMLLAKIDFLKVPKKEYENLPLEERITKAVIPYHNLSYEDQIKEKEKAVKSVLRKFGSELAQMNPELKKFVHWHKIRRRGQVCEIDDFVHSPITEGYRNKCEFTIGKSSGDSDKPIVGFRVASYKEGSVEVGPIDHLRHLNDKMKQVVKLMEKFLETSEHEPFDPFSHKGVWRQLTVRTSNNSDVMITVVIHPQEIDEEGIQKIKDDLLKFFTEGDGVDAGVTSLFFQKYGQKQSGKDIEYEHLFGKTYIEETILGKTFKASPDAFLQVNTPACEVLYSKIAEVAEIDQTSVVLDVCCGVGTIGLSTAESAYKVLGVEITEKAVEDARSNAEANGVANAVFYHGKAEDHIDNMIERAQRVNTIAIVDPPRAGLNGTVMNALRKCEYLDKLVYISCDPQAALPNFQALSRPRSKTYKGSYFVPIRATPVDLFPDTPHYELIIVFERYDECKWDRIMDGNPRPKDQAYYDRVPVLKYDPAEYAKEKEEKREKRERERSESMKSRRGGRARRGEGGYGGGRRGGYSDRYEGKGWSKRESWEKGSGKPWAKGGRGRRNWGKGYEEEYEDDDFDRRNRRRFKKPFDSPGRSSYRRGASSRGGDLPQKFRLNFGQGFQEGFQTALEALTSQGFGQVAGGGWNKPQNTGEVGRGSMGFNMNNPKQIGGEDRSNRNWGFSGNDGNNIETSPTFNIETSYSNPSNNPAGFMQRGGYNQNSGSGIGGWGSGRSANDDQAGSQWSQDDSQSYNEPSGKKWKGDGGYNQNYNYF